MDVDTHFDGQPQSLRWLCERLRGVDPDSARFWHVLRRFVERAQDEGAEVAQSEEGPIAIEWPDGTWSTMTGAAVGLGALYEVSRRTIH